jgi:glutamate:GABA antiporter
MSVILYMGMYLFMFSSAIKLRRTQPDRERPIKIRGLNPIAVVGMLAAVSAIVLGLTPPAGFSSVSPTVYALIVAGGVIVLAVPPQIIYRMRRPSWSDDARPDADVDVI